MSTPFTDHLGIQFTQNDDKQIVGRLELEEHHANKRGVAHGGVVMSLLDSVLGGAVIQSIPDEWWCATTSLTTQFIRGGTGVLTAKGRVVRRGRRIAFAEGTVHDERGRLVASAKGTWHLWQRMPGTPKRAEPGHVVLESTGENIRVGKIVCVGRNYLAHRVEMKAPTAGPPVLFLKPSTALFHPDAPLRLPDDAGAIHHELELVALIGKAGKQIATSDALHHVRGFGVGLDLTLRDLQSGAKQRGEPWSLAKGFDHSAPVSPFVDREQVGDGSGLGLRLSVNGETRQDANTSEMERSVAELVHFASQWMSLQPGDLLFTGTPAGVGPLSPGDRVEAEIEKVGRLQLTIEDRGAGA